MTTQGRTRRSSDATEKADLVPAAAFSISSGFRVQSTQSCRLRSSRYGTTERPQSRGKPTAVSSVDDDAFAPITANRATSPGTTGVPTPKPTFDPIYGNLTRSA